MPATTKNTVAVFRSRSECMNCGSNYLGGWICAGCDTDLKYAASGMIHPDAQTQVTEFAKQKRLVGGFAGWTDGHLGGCISPTEF